MHRTQFLSNALMPALVVALATACGRSKPSPISTRGDDAVSGGNAGSDASGASSDASGAGSDASGTSSDAPTLPQFACDAVASQQFDATFMQAYRVTPEVTAAVESTLQLMSPAQKAGQMMGVPVGRKDYRDIQRSPDVEVPGVGVIRGYRYRDAGRGVNLDAGQDNRPDDDKNFATVFPTPSLRAASWDL